LLTTYTLPVREYAYEHGEVSIFSSIQWSATPHAHAVNDYTRD
jgi:hypothetical protein